MSIYTNSERRNVFYNVGAFDAQRGKFIKAPFSRILIENEWYIETESAGASPQDSMATYTGPNALLLDDEFDTERFLMGRGEGWNSLAYDVVDMNEMGTLTDNWKGVHQFGFI